MKLAAQQSQEIARARQAIEHMLGSRVDPPPPLPEKKSNSEKSRPSPTKSKLDLMAHFSEPPAPPPQAPLPEKPDVARALADPVIQPLLRRSDTARPGSASPTRTDHSGDILRLCEELKAAKGQLSNQSERMKTLENELAQERTARESAEERAQKLEERKDSPTSDDPTSVEGSPKSRETDRRDIDPALQAQIDQLTRSMDEMKQQMEQYRQRAESAEAERDEARQSLAEMVEQKRKEMQDSSKEASRSASSSPRSIWKNSPRLDSKGGEPNGHAVKPESLEGSAPFDLLDRIGVEEGKPITPAQVEKLQQLTQEVLESPNRPNGSGHIVAPLTSFTAVVLLGWIAMQYMNSWPKVDR